MLLILSTSLLFAAPTEPVERELVAITQALFDSIGSGNADFWARALADDAFVIDEFGRRQDKLEMVRSIRPFPPGFSGSIEVREPRVHVYGSTAVVECEAFEREEVFGQKLVVRYRTANTFVKVGTDWKLLTMVTVTLPTQPPLLAVRGLPRADYPGIYRYGSDRAYRIELDGDKLSYTTRPGGKPIPLEPIAKDVFMEGGGERNLLIFRRGDAGKVEGLIQRRKFNDLWMKR